jgi:hypothetical protein
LAEEDPETIEARIAAAPTREEKLPIYMTLVRKHAADGKIAEAEAAIEAMIAVIEAAPRPAEPSKFGKADDQLGIIFAKALHLEIARELSKSGDAVAAREQVAKASDAILGIPKEAGLGKSFALLGLVAAHIDVGDLEAARRMVEQMPDDYDRNMAAKQVVQALAKSGDVAAAIAVAKHVTHPLGRGRTVGEIAGELIHAGELMSAKMLLAGLSAAAENVQGYREVGTAMTASGNEAELSDWLPQMPSAAARAYACLGAAEKRTGPAQQLAPGQ